MTLIGGVLNHVSHAPQLMPCNPLHVLVEVYARVSMHIYINLSVCVNTLNTVSYLVHSSVMVYRTSTLMENMAVSE